MASLYRYPVGPRPRGGSSCHEDILHIDWCNREILHSTTIRTLVKPGHGTGKLLRKSDEVRRNGMASLAVCLEATRRHVQSLLRSTFNRCKPLEFHPLPPTTRALYPQLSHSVNKD